MLSRLWHLLVRDEGVKRPRSESRHRRFGFVQRTSALWGNVQASLAIMLDIAVTTFKNAAKSHRGLVLRILTRW